MKLQKKDMEVYKVKKKVERFINQSKKKVNEQIGMKMNQVEIESCFERK